MQLSYILLLALIAVSMGIQAQCGTGGAATPYEPCTEYCCLDDNQVVTDPSQCNCDNASECPSGYECCPGTGNGKGTCFNPKERGCCAFDVDNNAVKQYEQYDITTKQCCPYLGPQDNTVRCVCRSGGANANDCRAANDKYSSTSCCMGTTDTQEDTLTPAADLRGSCYNPNDSHEACCTRHYENVQDPTLTPVPTILSQGFIYDPALAQCCSVNGIQPKGVECKCTADSHCPGSETCCTQASVAGYTSECSEHCWGEKVKLVPNVDPDMCKGLCVPSGKRCTACGIIDNWEECCAYSEPGKLNGAKSVKFNPKSQMCCSWKFTSAHRTFVGAANAYGVVTRAADVRCPCNAENPCASGSECCYTGTDHRLGWCTKEGEGCCTTTTYEGKSSQQIYDTEKEICCKVNGVADVGNVPFTGGTVTKVVSSFMECVCAQDSDCPSGGTCCVNTELQSELAKGAWQCKLYNNNLQMQYKDGKSYTCPGRCINPDWQTCCGVEGAACFSEYEECCESNSVCCNKHTSNCKNFDSVEKPYGDREDEFCTMKQHHTPTIVFFAFVFPIMLAIASIALVVYAVLNALSTLKHGDYIPTVLLIVFAVLSALMGMLVLFSPLWKYALVCLLSDVLLLHACSATSRWTRRLALFIAIISFLYVVDPFAGNAILSFHSWFRNAGDANEEHGASGLQWAARALHYKNNQFGGSYNHEQCTGYYHYFQLDKVNEGGAGGVRDVREENPVVTTFGLCSWEWLSAISVMAGMLIVFQILVSVLALLVLPKKPYDVDSKVIVPVSNVNA